MIGLGLIFLGLVSGYLAVGLWSDFRRNRKDFAPSDNTGLHPLWKTTFRIQRFNSHLDMWVFGTLAPAMIAGGLITLLS